MTRKLLLLLALAGVLTLLSAPAAAVVRLDPELEAELRASNALEPVIRQLKRARDEGFFDLPPDDGGASASKRAGFWSDASRIRAATRSGWLHAISTRGNSRRSARRP